MGDLYRRSQNQVSRNLTCNCSLLSHSRVQFFLHILIFIIILLYIFLLFSRPLLDYGCYLVNTNQNPNLSQGLFNIDWLHSWISLGIKAFPFRSDILDIISNPSLLCVCVCLPHSMSMIIFSQLFSERQHRMFVFLFAKNTKRLCKYSEKLFIGTYCLNKCSNER